MKDMMPHFDLVQPDRPGVGAGSAAGARRRRLGARRRLRQLRLVQEPGQAALRGGRPGGARRTEGRARGRRRHRDRRHDQPHGHRERPARARPLRSAGRGGERGGQPADPERRHARRQHLPGHPLLVLPLRHALLPGGRKHLLRRHAGGHEPRARPLRRRPLRGGHPVRLGPGAGGAGRGDGGAQHPRGAGDPRRESSSCRRAWTSPA